MEKKYYSYNMFKADTIQLLKTLQNSRFDTIVGLSRGGLSLAQAIAESLELRDLQTVQTQLYNTTEKNSSLRLVDNTSLKEGRKILVVDDIADSGETLQVVVSYLQKKYPTCDFESATLFYNKSSVYEPTYWVNEATCWIEFFWETDFKL